MKKIVLISLLMFCATLMSAQENNNNQPNNKVVENSLELLITSGKWNVEYVKFGKKGKSIVRNEWMSFLPGGKCDIVISDIDFGENWFFKRKSNIVMIKVFTELTEVTKFYEFEIDKINNEYIILSALLDSEMIKIALKK